jgi:hypothetical protein
MDETEQVLLWWMMERSRLTVRVAELEAAGKPALAAEADATRKRLAEVEVMLSKLRTTGSRYW